MRVRAPTLYPVLWDWVDVEAGRGSAEMAWTMLGWNLALAGALYRAECRGFRRGYTYLPEPPVTSAGDTSGPAS